MPLPWCVYGNSRKNKKFSAYKRGVKPPSNDVLIKLAETFDVPLDYLSFETKGQPAKLNIQDRELLRRFEPIDTLTEEEKGLAKNMGPSYFK